MKAVLQKFDSQKEEEKEQILYVLFLITGCFNSSQLQNKSRESVATLFMNIRTFLKDTCSSFTKNDSLLALVIKTVAVNQAYDMCTVSEN